jgi:hypothetical protein
VKLSLISIKWLLQKETKTAKIVHIGGRHMVVDGGTQNALQDLEKNLTMFVRKVLGYTLIETEGKFPFILMS